MLMYIHFRITKSSNQGFETEYVFTRVLTVHMDHLHKTCLRAVSYTCIFFFGQRYLYIYVCM